MEVFHFSEQPYPEGWGQGLESLRNTIPNALCDPKIARQIYMERQDEWALCDELGINVAFNEHHCSSTCISAAPEVTMSILARITKNVQILPIGFQIANRPNPLLVAELIAMADVISGGRLQVGLVKGAPFELSPANSNPGRYMERFWEAHDLILKALSTRDGPFNFEGEFFHYRQANIWPQPWQQPHPPIWIPTGSPESTAEVARRGHNLVVFLAGRNLKKLYDIYKKTTVEMGRPMPGPEKFGYLSLCAVAETREKALQRAHDIHGYLRTTTIISEAFMNPPGYMSVDGNVKWLRMGVARGRAGNHYPATMKDGTVINQATATMEQLIDANILFAGTPDDVYNQMCEFTDHVGGVGSHIMMFQGGTMPHAEATDSLKMFARDVLPRLKERYPSNPAVAKAA